MKLSKALEMLENDNSLKFMGVFKEGEGVIKRQYSILNCDPHGYINFDNYKENGILEVDMKREFNGMIKIEREWELIQNPVTWDEVLESNKMVRIEHELIDKNMFWDEELEELEDLRKFYELDEIMSLLSCRLDSESLKTVIKEGKWYLEQ